MKPNGILALRGFDPQPDAFTTTTRTPFWDIYSLTSWLLGAKAWRSRQDPGRLAQGGNATRLRARRLVGAAEGGRSEAHAALGARVVGHRASRGVSTSRRGP